MIDIKEFDRLYPSPAHAAAADWSDRYLLKRLDPEGSSFLNDRAGIVIGLVALAVGLLGGTAYVLMVGQTTKTAAAERTVQSVAAVPAVKRLVPLLPVLHVSAEPTSGLRRTIVEVPRFSHALKHAKPASERKGSSGWILDPLSGDALAAALVIDKQRTIELNSQQLDAMKTDNRAPSAIVNGGKDPSAS